MDLTNAGYKKRLFDFGKLNLILLTPFPLDVSEGLILTESFLSIEPVSKNLINHKVGLGGEVLISENFNGVHTLNLSSLPSAPCIQEIDLLKKLKTQFGMMIQNNSSPLYKGIASECRFQNKASVGIGTGGFKDMSYTIIMSDYIEVYLPK